MIYRPHSFCTVFHRLAGHFLRRNMPLSDAAFVGLHTNSSTTKMQWSDKEMEFLSTLSQYKIQSIHRVRRSEFLLSQWKTSKTNGSVSTLYFAHGPYFNYWVSWRNWSKFLMIVSSSFWLYRVMERRTTSNIYHWVWVGGSRRFSSNNADICLHCCSHLYISSITILSTS